MRGVRLPEGLDDDFTSFRDERDMTNSEALRTLVRDGLRDDDDEQETDSDYEPVGWALLAAAGGAFAFNFRVAAGLLAFVAAAVFLFESNRRLSLR